MAGRNLFADAAPSQPVEAPRGRNLFADAQPVDQSVQDNRNAAMQEGQLSPDGSTVVRPNGTTIPLGAPAVVNPENTQGFLASQQQEKPKKLQLPARTPPRVPIPTNWQVAKNAIAKGAAAVPDMFLNAAPNLVNLGTAAGGAVLYEAGLIDAPPDLPLENPNLAAKTGEAIGVINPEYNPQTTEQKYLDIGLQGATGGVLTGGSSLPAMATNAAAGAVGGMSSQAAADMGAPPIVQIGAGLIGGGTPAAGLNRMSGATRNTALAQQNAVRDSGFKAAREAGITIPASQSNPNSLLANTVDIIAGGRPKLQQAASIKNANKATQASARELGLDPANPITPSQLQAARNSAFESGYKPLESAGLVKVTPNFGTALDDIVADTLKAKSGFAGYDDGGLVKTIDSLRTKEFDAGAGVAMIRQLREDASSNYAKGDKKLGSAQKKAASAIEDEMERHLESTGQQGLLQNYKDARKQIAKTMTVEKALNEATGTVSAQALAKQLDKGVPLSGELRDIALAAKLPGASLSDTKYATPGASQLEMMAGVGGAVGTGNALLAALPFARSGVRELALTKAAGNLLGTPNYKQARLTKGNTNALIAEAGMSKDKRDKK